MSGDAGRAEIFDFVAVGVGPFNLGLACLTEPIDELNGLFLDRNERFDWHPGMLLAESTLQTPFIGDLVTLADPTSRFSFLNYVKSQGRIYAFYIKEDFFLMRKEFNQYCQWAAEQLPNVEFGQSVERIDYDDAQRLYCVTTRNVKTRAQNLRLARRLVLGTGASPAIPACCRGVADRVTHTSRYLADKAELQRKRSITVIGSGQSAAEIYYDLLQEIDVHGYRLDWVTRSPRFFPLELTKLTLEMTSPDYADYFHRLPAFRRDQLIKAQKGLYKGINASLINDIYDTLYNKSLSSDLDVNLHTNAELTRCAFDEATGRFTLGLRQTEQDSSFELETEAVVLGTGYAYRTPAFLKPIRHRIRWDESGRFAVKRNYAIDGAGEEIFVQNAELHTHGFVAPDLGMASYRNASIIREMTGREVYPIERRIAFQQFSAPRARARTAQRA
ncbi:lysine N(6)-hydroxylase/L-ornithine N(5)-oxygenase family protein [Hansschlegelia sp. KR7-227]|uniref:lysine N(6)-hydroxylase/L-ornithine N(5)-oxygenase family protein n=1 Tax=Hansschlegelia sp. KR7-227 TaxID=3400914 RepID=UPI003BFAD077